jgi:hypothetical protein
MRGNGHFLLAAIYNGMTRTVRTSLGASIAPEADVDDSASR